MALEIIRICDTCHTRHEQIIDHGRKTVTYEVPFTCSDCVLKKGREIAKSEHDREVISKLPEDRLAILHETAHGDLFGDYRKS